MSDQKVEQPDVEEITNKADFIAEKASLIKNKAFSLRNIAKPKPESEKATVAGDFASEIKNRLDHIQGVLDEAIESLARFAG